MQILIVLIKHIFEKSRGPGAPKRLVVDLRAANQAVTPFNLELPQMTEVLNDMARSSGQYFTSVDLASGFWQIKLAEGISREVTSFSDPLTKKRYQFTVAPFGLANSPAAMIIAVMNSLGSLLGQACH